MRILTTRCLLSKRKMLFQQLFSFFQVGSLFNLVKCLYIGVDRPYREWTRLRWVVEATGLCFIGGEKKFCNMDVRTWPDANTTRRRSGPTPRFTKTRPSLAAQLSAVFRGWKPSGTFLTGSTHY